MSYLDWASLPSENWPVVTITVSFDTGWQTKGTGKSYNSLSGHSFMFGAYTRKVLSCLVKSKMCKICNLAENNKLPAPVHVCVKNYEGSSKGMEETMALELKIQAKRQRGFIVGFIIVDDDSLMRATLKHPYKHLSATMQGFVWPHATPKEDGKLGAKPQDMGKLPLDVPQPKWLADPTHQTKVVALQFFSLLKQGKGSSSISKADCLHLKKYWGYMLKQNRGEKSKRC
jgi:hypothetical protein